MMFMWLRITRASYDEIAHNGGKVIMSRKPHETGTDRIAEAAENLTADIIFNIQGDEPFIKRAPVQKLIEAFADDPGGCRHPHAKRSMTKKK
jgi:3-deoxy-manno-octulosonate cytidylyltransferase (CMP-KDO synthetase)